MALSCRKVDLTDLEQRIKDSMEMHIELMGLGQWYISLDFGPVEDEAAETGVKPEYQRAEITFDPEQMKNEEEFIHHYCRHELMHVLIWFFFDIATELTYKVAQSVVRKLEEKVVHDLEHMPLWEKLYPKLLPKDDAEELKQICYTGQENSEAGI